jgi:hypothetical protein
MTIDIFLDYWYIVYSIFVFYTSKTRNNLYKNLPEDGSLETKYVQQHILL